MGSRVLRSAQLVKWGPVQSRSVVSAAWKTRAPVLPRCHGMEQRRLEQSGVSHLLPCAHKAQGQHVQRRAHRPCRPSQLCLSCWHSTARRLGRTRGGRVGVAAAADKRLPFPCLQQSALQHTWSAARAGSTSQSVKRARGVRASLGPPCSLPCSCNGAEGAGRRCCMGGGECQEPGCTWWRRRWRRLVGAPGSRGICSTSVMCQLKRPGRCARKICCKRGQLHAGPGRSRCCTSLDKQPPVHKPGCAKQQGEAPGGGGGGGGW